MIDPPTAVELMALVRTEGGFAADARKGGRRFPSAETLTAIASRSVNAQERLTRHRDASGSRGARTIWTRCGLVSSATRQRKRAGMCSTSTTSCSSGGRC